MGSIFCILNNSKYAMLFLFFYSSIYFLKSFQRLGYFIPITKVPLEIISNIKAFLKIQESIDYTKYDKSSVRFHHIGIIHNYLKIKPYNKETRHLIVKTAFEVSKTKDNDADIINIIIEELIKQRYEIPAFSTLVRTTRRIRYRVYTAYFKYVYEKLDIETINKIDNL